MPTNSWPECPDQVEVFTATKLPSAACSTTTQPYDLQDVEPFDKIFSSDDYLESCGPYTKYEMQHNDLDLFEPMLTASMPDAVVPQHAAVTLLPYEYLTESNELSLSCRNGADTPNRSMENPDWDSEHTAIQQQKECEFAIHEHTSPKIEATPAPPVRKVPKQKLLPVNNKKRPRDESGMKWAYDIFLQYTRRDYFTGVVDATGIFTEECYEEWLRTRKTEVQHGFESFRRALLSHVTGQKHRKPFSPEVEASILPIIRRNEVWACFRNKSHDSKPCNIGLYGFRGMGYWESQALKKNKRGISKFQKTTHDTL
mmetsp:Transcript_8971/g.15782  ORF Transcript_8971/g.15782 Transcript_8971/m.15782 type:complete len:313 (-) Transcript_8971:210-1148(-)|eukprot:CAMPEP_0184549090 /NCGR_PEP_ID=MMETSP0199_2-20130426/6592_1 /TAXON_ID=1112570 /ORGANISM="Thraustochytrium sp., Strain LLF1b" /LENGTH=312 /DNA_ID=CAMNT_0026943775 /DNA_START=366 /DNA_END=1307 /DNA_ORIENTATION=+